MVFDICMLLLEERYTRALSYTSASFVGRCSRISHLGVDEEEVHLEEGEDGLQDRVSERQLSAAGGVGGGAHGDFQTVKH